MHHFHGIANDPLMFADERRQAHLQARNINCSTGSLHSSMYIRVPDGRYFHKHCVSKLLLYALDLRCYQYRHDYPLTDEGRKKYCFRSKSVVQREELSCPNRWYFVYWQLVECSGPRAKYREYAYPNLEFNRDCRRTSDSTQGSRNLFDATPCGLRGEFPVANGTPTYQGLVVFWRCNESNCSASKASSNSLPGRQQTFRCQRMLPSPN